MFSTYESMSFEYVYSSECIIQYFGKQSAQMIGLVGRIHLCFVDSS